MKISQIYLVTSAARYVCMYLSYYDSTGRYEYVLGHKDIAVGNFRGTLHAYLTSECERMEPLRVGVDRRTLMPGTIKQGLSCSWDSTPGEIRPRQADLMATSRM